MRALSRVAVRHPWRVISSAVIIVVFLAIAGINVEDDLKPTDLDVPGTETSRWSDLRLHRFGSDAGVLLRGPQASVEKQGRALAVLLTREHGIKSLSPWSSGSVSRQLRPGPGSALIVLDLGDSDHSDGAVRRTQKLIASAIRPPVHGELVGEAPVAKALNQAVADSSTSAEHLALPVLLIVLLAVFRSVMAAAVPLAVAGAAVLSGRGVLDILAHRVNLDAVSLTLASMMGLALGVDYSLLLVSRFREELGRGAAPRAAASMAANTAGRTAVFAGVVLTAIMVGALLITPGSALLSSAAGTIVVTLLGMISAAVLTPALLAVLGHRIEMGRLGSPPAQGGGRLGAVIALATRRPQLSAGVVLVALVLASLPVLGVKTTPPDPGALPSDNPAIAAFADAQRVGVGPAIEVMLRTQEGPITRADRLTAMNGLEGRLRRLDLVKAVAGPGSFAGTAVAFQGDTRADGRAASPLTALDAAARGLRQLRTGLAAAQSGMQRLRAGGQAGEKGARRLGVGTGQAATGARELATGATRVRSGLRAARAGARRLAAGAQQAQAATHAVAGGAGSLAGGLGRQLGPGLRRLAGGLRQGGGDLGSLRTAAQRAQRELETADRELQGMSVGKVDPRYRAAITAVGTALAAVTGRDPRDGSPVQAGYDGLDRALDQAAGQADSAADAAGQLARGADAATRGARRLRDGALRVTAGIDALRRGLNVLTSGLGGPAAQGVDQLSSGGAALAGGLGRLHAGTGQLATGLARLRRGQARLAGGLERELGKLGQRSVDQSQSRAVDALSDLEARSPGFFASGFAGLAALDGARPLDRAAATYLVDTDHGGDAGRIFVIPDLRPNDPQAAGLVRKIRAMTHELPPRLGLSTAVGGPTAALEDYDHATSRRLPWLIVATALITYLLLVPILRSLVLPAIAVVLNLLTVAVAFGALTLLFVGDNPPLGGPGALDVISVATIFAITFALAIDYQVFLLVRMREAYVSTQRNDAAIAFGIERTARVVTGAAVIMLGVFIAFATTDFASVQQFGVGLAVAVAVDATVVRLVLLPALMRMFGLRTWWLPRRLDDRLPLLDVEGSDDAIDPLVLSRRAADAW